LSKDEHSRFGAIIGLGMAYAGTNREVVIIFFNNFFFII
jgi:phosphate/sulfate permease